MLRHNGIMSNDDRQVPNSRLARSMASSTTMPVLTSSAPIGSSLKQHFRLLGDRPRNGSRCLFAAGQLRREMVKAPVPEVDQLQRRFRWHGIASDLRDQRDVFPRSGWGSGL